MKSFEYEQPKAIEMTIDNAIDRIANIAHSCYQVAPKPHDANVAFVKTLCSVYHMAMLDHGFLHFRFDRPDFDKLDEPYGTLSLIPEEYVKFFSFSITEEYVYLTVSLRTLTGAIDTISKKTKGEQGEDLLGYMVGNNFANLVCTLIAGLDDEYKDVILTHIKDEDEKKEIVERFDRKIPFEIITEEGIKTLSEEIRGTQQYLVYRLTTDRGVTHELVRHRLCAFAQESTRYCNYSKQKFENKIHIIEPLDHEERKDLYDNAFEAAAEAYFALLSSGAKPEQARAVLPNALKAEITITANLNEWKHIFFQRLAPDAHPEAKRAVQFVYDDMKNKGYIE